MRLTSLASALLASLALVAQAAEFENLAPKAQAYRGGQHVKAQPDGLIIAEAEEFKIDARRGARVSGEEWQAKNWGENYYAATFANSFLSRKAFLGAGEQTDGATATTEVEIPAAGRYLALVRYEAAYRFETQFKLRVEQGGQVKLDRLYGARDNVKIWAFKGGGIGADPATGALQKEVAWGWGAVENVVWEGHDAFVELQPGKATITLVADKQPEPAAKRNVDLVMLTTDEAQVKDRIANERYLPLDGMLTQSGDVFLRVTNLGREPITVAVPNGTEHSPYWVHKRNWKPGSIQVAAGQASEWEEVGSLLDSLNDGQWAITATPATKDAAVRFKAEFAARQADGSNKTIATFESDKPALALAYDANTRYSQRVRQQRDVLFDLLAYLKKQKLDGQPPKRTLIFGYSFDPRPEDAEYTAALGEFLDIMAISNRQEIGRTKHGLPAGYIDVRGLDNAKLEEHCKQLQAEGRAGDVAVVSFGDEIGLAAPDAEDQKRFGAWLESRGVKPADVVPGAADWSAVVYDAKGEAKESNPRLFYYSRIFAFRHGIDQLKARTEIVRKYLPQAHTGANFSPHADPAYLGHTYQWVSLFREGGMTMPWSEDYTWQLPVGSQQMTMILLDLGRAAVRHTDAPLHFYVMPHWPGNTPNSWRRNFYGALGHGMKQVNLFEFRPVQAAYTENHVSLPEMFHEVRKSFHELATFEDIIQEGKVRPAQVGLWFSEAADVWHDHTEPFAADKRAMYIAIKHQQVPLDIVVEQDALDPRNTLKQYKVLYLTDLHVTRAASRAIADWVKQGGRLFVTAGGGMLDEFNQPNEIMQELLGVKQTTLETPEAQYVRFIKQDLPFVEAMDQVAIDMGPNVRATPLEVLGAKSRFTLDGAEATATFGDGSPAVAERKQGKGSTVYIGFLPGLSYFKPAIPKRPVDRGSTDDAMAHFVPTGFHPAASRLIGNDLDVDRLATCSNHLVEAYIVESKNGTVITLVNWSGGPIEDLVVTVRGVKGGKASLAGGGKVERKKGDDGTAYTLDLNVADALILR